MDSPLDPLDDAATYRVACPVCNEAVWASHAPPPAEGEDLLAGHTCPGAVEAQIEPGTNGNEGVTVGEPSPPTTVEPAPMVTPGEPMPTESVDAAAG